MLHRKYAILVIFAICGCSSLHENPGFRPLCKSDWKLFDSPVKEYEEPFIPQEDEFKKEEPLSQLFNKQISISITDSVPVKEAFLQIAEQAGIGIQLHSAINEKGIVFIANKEPVINVIRDLCDLAHLKYQIKGNTVRIEPDEPYSKTYSLQFLALSRETQNSMSVSSEISAQTTSSTSSAKSSDNGSSSIIKATTKTDFWQELETAIAALLSDGASKGAIISIHKQGGLITIRANEKQHNIVQNYLEQLRLLTTAQVLIEAKILEVALKDEYRNGIDWKSLKKHFIFGVPLSSTLQGSQIKDAARGSSDLFTLGLQDRDLSVVAYFVEKFGSVKTISSPRLTVMNNQAAVLKVAKNEVFFKMEYNKQYASSPNGHDSDITTSQMQTIPIGLVMTVQPAVNLKTGDIILTLRPTISRVAGIRSDPGVALFSRLTTNASDIKEVHSEVPIVEVRELDSVLTVHSGDVVVMGGLMQEKSKSEKAGVPGASSVPLFGAAFSSDEKESNITELVIFLRAKIIPPRSSSISNADKRFYKTFQNDPRPLRFT